MKKIKILLLVFLFMFLLFILTDVYLLLLKPLDTGVEITKNQGDIMLVLGGGLKSGNKIGVSTAERLEKAVQLYLVKEMKIIVSDGSLYRKSPAIKMFKEYLVGKGIKPEHILFEGKSQTTYENFIYTKNMLINEKSKAVLVITSPYHQKRSSIIMKYLNLNNYKVIKVDKSEVYQADSIRQRIRSLRLIIREYFGLLKFRILRR
ncbi:MAG: YdcF family protein [Acidobacteriota bacterium]